MFVPVQDNAISVFPSFVNVGLPGCGYPSTIHVSVMASPFETGFRLAVRVVVHALAEMSNKLSKSKTFYAYRSTTISLKKKTISNLILITV